MRFPWSCLLVLALAGCGTQPIPELSPAETISPARAALQSRLDKLLGECVDAAQHARTPAEAETAARAAYARWARDAKGTHQFQVQAQALAGGAMQLQVQAQLADNGDRLQAQRQVLLGALTARKRPIDS